MALESLEGCELDNSGLNDSTTLASLKTNRLDCLEFWESQHTRPQFKPMAQTEYLASGAGDYLQRCIEHPYLPKEEQSRQKFRRIKELVELAYEHIPVYREKYQSVGFSPSQLNSLDDFHKVPVITKRELIKAFPDHCLNPHFDRDLLFPTRSSGASGETLLIRVDYQAILDDTIQGVRQFYLQSGGKYGPDDLLAHVYTVPWWFNNVGNKYYSAFISNVLPPEQVAEHLKTLKPEILSGYPTNIEALLPYITRFNEGLYLVVTHSEYSSRLARTQWSQKFGCPVLDEYSSEEGTRMALEMPCGHYHVCEDTIHLEVVERETFQPQKDGISGLSVITNLLNEAMPFIRYVQGDLVTRPAIESPCDIKWSQIESIDGRVNDSFVNQQGRRIPAGSLLDITYRWMFDRDLYLDQFELVQKNLNLVEANFVLGGDGGAMKLDSSITHLEELLSLCLEQPVKVKANIVKHFGQKGQKRKPIRCEVP